MMKMRFLAIDGFNLIRRIFEARKVTSEEDMAAVIDASRSSVIRALGTHKPSHAAIVLEHHDRTWRHLLYPQYKANRSETPALLLSELPRFEAAFLEAGVVSCGVASYEADDVIATMVTAVTRHEGNAIILSTDKIYLQLVGPRITVYDHFAEQTFDQAYIEQRYGIRLGQYVDYLSLVGDKSNNIKGVPGVGPKSAIEIFGKFESLDEILSSVEDSSIVNKVQGSEVEARRSRQLVTLKTDVELGLNLKSFRLP